MEFLARSWSVSATELSKALSSMFPQQPPPPPPPPPPPRRTAAPAPLTMGGWMKEHKERRRAEARARRAQAYAAASVAGVAAAVAAVTAAQTSTKTGAAVSSAAALVAVHCMETVQAMGADREHVAAAVRSAVGAAQTSSDILALTGGSATALRGATALRARVDQEEGNKEVQEAISSPAMAFVSQGGELLKRTRKGFLHWKRVSIHMNSSFQVVVKMKCVHMAGAFVKKKKSVVVEVCPDVAAWVGRGERTDPGGGGGGEDRAYFGVKTTTQRVIEFECRSASEKQLWIKGIRQMLDMSGNGDGSGSSMKMHHHDVPSCLPA